MNIYLIGMPGSGKTKIAKLLALKLNRKTVDLDNAIEFDQLMFIDDIFAKLGEEHFRKVETKVLKELAENNDNLVISTGGGIVVNKENKSIMKGVKIYIDTKIDIIKARIKDDYQRPLLLSHSLDELYDKRFLKYQDFADYIVSNNQSEEACITEIMKILKENKLI